MSRSLSPSPGQLFLYAGPRRFGFVRTVAVGQVLGLEPAIGAVHISTLRESGEHLMVDIWHIPISRKQFESSVRRLLEIRELDSLCSERMARWRQRHSLGEAGIFAVPIWKVEAKAWETAQGDRSEVTSKSHFIEYVYPLKDEEGSWRIVEAASVPRNRRERARVYDRGAPPGKPSS